MSATRGILAAAGYVPYRRLQRSEIAKFFGSGGGKGSRSVASYDEDTTTMGVEAARLALGGAEVRPDTLLFATADPAYLEKTNATTIHAALRLDADTGAFDVGGAVRSGIGALELALRSNDTTLVVTSDRRGGLPTSADESASGDGAAAILVGEGDVIAEYIGGAQRSAEFIDRWRTPGDARPRQWEERFGEVQYLPLADEAFRAALKSGEIEAGQIDVAIVTGPHTRAVKALAGKLGVSKVADDLTGVVGQTGAAHAALLLANALETAEPGQVIALVQICDGADVLLFRATDRIAARRAATRSVAAQLEHTADIPYGKYLSWRDVVRLEPPRRPEPGRISASISARTRDFKYGFVGSQDHASGAPHLPPQRISREGGALDEMEPLPMSDVEGTISTFTIDRIAYSPSPPIAFAIVDFDNGARLPVELCDVDTSTLAMGDKVEMTFRRLFTADGIHNYFWKARPLRG
jgi:hydroxymethylglutaryl-CoA synthase